MFTPNYFIDSITTTQKKAVEIFVTHDELKKELVKLFEAQNKFAKTQYNTSIELAQAFWKNATEAVYAKKAA